MYFVNRSEIEQILNYFDGVLQEIGENTSFTENKLEAFALERMIHVLVESILDTGNRMIDGFIMRDPGSYYDIIDILTDERVLPTEDEDAYKALIDARQEIVKHYYETDSVSLEKTLKAHQHVLQQFSTHIRTYLDNEIGVANAFANESQAGNRD